MALEKSDTMGQQYHTPIEAILQHGSDVIIVGRAIYAAANPEAAARSFRELGWAAYLARTTNTTK